MNPKKFDFNPHYFCYGTLYIYLFAVAIAIGVVSRFIKPVADILFYFFHPGEIAKFYFVGRLTSAIFGAAAVVLTYLIGRKIFGRKGGMIASLLLSLSPLLVINAHYVAVDVTAVFFICLTFYLALNLLESHRTKFYILSGIAAGLAADAKYSAGLIVLVVPMISLLRTYKSPWDILKCWFRPKVLLTYLCTFVTFLILCPYIITSNEEVMSLLQYDARVMTGESGISLRGFFYYLEALYHGLGLLLFLLSLAGLVYALVKRSKADIAIIFWVAVSILIFALAEVRFDRYILVILPFLCLLGAGLIERIMQKKILLGIGVILFVVISTFLYTAAYNRLFVQPNTRTVTGQWIAENIPTGSKIGLRKDSYQFEVPPLNKIKYHLCITGDDLQNLKRAKPDYFVANGMYLSEGFRKYLTDGVEYKLIKEFNSPPRILGIPFNQNPHEDYLYIYPRFFVFKKLGTK